MMAIYYVPSRVQRSDGTVVRYRLSTGRLYGGYPVVNIPGVSQTTTTPFSGIAVTPTRILITFGGTIQFYDRDGNRIASEDITISGGLTSIEASLDYIYVGTSTGYFAYQYNGNAVPSLNLSLLESGSFLSFSIFRTSSFQSGWRWSGD